MELSRFVYSSQEGLETFLRALEVGRRDGSKIHLTVHSKRWRAG
jgi:hypothetical protein